MLVLKTPSVRDSSEMQNDVLMYREGLKGSAAGRRHKLTNLRLLFCEEDRQFVASELKDPIWHSLEWQIGSFSSEATNLIGWKSTLDC